MPPRTIILGVTIIAIIIIIAGIGWTVVNSANEPTPTSKPTPTQEVTPTPNVTQTPPATLSPEIPTISPSPSTSPSPLAQNEVRDVAMMYILATHPETSAIIPNSLVWTGGKVDTTILGSETYIYVSGGWTTTIQNLVVKDPAYNITANYSAANVFVIWQGMDQSGTFTETNYTSSGLEGPTPSPTQLATQEQVREQVMLFIRTRHNETAQYMITQAWEGGRVDAGTVGSELYEYTSYGWNVTIRYPVTPSPVYTVSATYVSPVSQIWPAKVIFDWQGTWQSGVVVEGNYTYTP